MVKNPENKNEISAKVKFSDGSVYEKDGQINFMNSNVDSQTGTIKLRAVFENQEMKLRPGQFLRLTLEGLTRIGALSVPQEALMQGSNGAFVYKVNANNQVEVVPVHTGVTSPDGRWIIDEGLNAGDKVIVAGVMKVKAGMSVEPNLKKDDKAEIVAK